MSGEAGASRRLWLRRLMEVPDGAGAKERGDWALRNAPGVVKDVLRLLEGGA